ncbi:MAG TPA: hypothetical protein DCY46_02725 [Lactobacillus sp.]|nr:hypothetical protein [Lactobacillus sp.]
MSKQSVTDQAKTLVSEMYNVLDDQFPTVKSLLLQAYKELDRDNQAPQAILTRLLDGVYANSIKPRAPYPQGFQDNLARLTLLTRSNGYGYTRRPTL